MEIEKGKLYYDTRTKQFFRDKDITDKIAVYCSTKDDWDYVNKIMGWGWDYSESFAIRLLNKENYRLSNVKEAEREGYRVITIDQFKGFYQNNEEQDPCMCGVIDISRKKDAIVHNVIQKYQRRSAVGIEKYGTTLEENEDGIEIFLTHLQEEMMDATLYIEKLKNKFAELKKHL